MNRYDRASALVTAAVAALVLLACLALRVNPAEAATGTYVSEQRMELILSATDTPVGSFDQPLCLGIGARRGVKLPRFARFVCSAVVYPDAHIIMRVRLSRTGRVVFG